MKNDDAEIISIDVGRTDERVCATSNDTGESQRHSDLVIEIECYLRELTEWDISMEMLVANSPKRARLRDVYRKIVFAAAADEEIMQIVWTKRHFPVKKVSELTEVPEKTIERARTFIIGSLIIHAGEYKHLKDFVTYQAV